MKATSLHSVYINSYKQFHIPELHQRYYPVASYYNILNRFSDWLYYESVGRSVNDREVGMYRFGKGPLKVLMWSQMHGNETTTTRALTDVISFLNANKRVLEELSTQLQVYLIPVLNPDGATAYTRVNANGVDLNRDAQKRSQPESGILREVYERIGPDICLNLHDQRTIFSAGHQPKPATISFLSPSCDKERTVNSTRKTSMQLIAGMNAMLQHYIPGQVGRYDDGFNLNCIGDTFQSEGTPTILFEAGHFNGDYQRIETRKYLGMALYGVLEMLAKDNYNTISYKAYEDIPENRKLFCDILIKGLIIEKNGELPEKADLAFQFREALDEGKISFVPEFMEWRSPASLYGHLEIDAPKGCRLSFSNKEDLALKARDLLKRLKKEGKL